MKFKMKKSFYFFKVNCSLSFFSSFRYREHTCVSHYSLITSTRQANSVMQTGQQK